MLIDRTGNQKASFFLSFSLVCHFRRSRKGLLLCVIFSEVERVSLVCPFLRGRESYFSVIFSGAEKVTLVCNFRSGRDGYSCVSFL